jgi:hypothetical protein
LEFRHGCFMWTATYACPSSTAFLRIQVCFFCPWDLQTAKRVAYLTVFTRIRLSLFKVHFLVLFPYLFKYRLTCPQFILKDQ